ncbi:hypothetical protein PIB30_061921 [Stylosanthes scabra]|uniref:Uncharacterized protein n=1 Tax=Stylosanthes scabra TaxID=79078 RepID=A0ABU6ZJP4_9FABA|nr:hypothetical protein [Stylosanthes scabra]
MVRPRRDLGCIRPKLHCSFASTRTPVTPAHDVARQRDTLVCPCHGLGHIRPKLRRSFAPMHALMVPTHISRARAVPWCVRALALVPLGRKSATSTRPHFIWRACASPLSRLFGPPNAWCARALRPRIRAVTLQLKTRSSPILPHSNSFLLTLLMDRKRKQITPKRKGKLIVPPTKKSPRLVAMQTSQPPVSPTSVLKPNKLVVLALVANTLTPHSKAVEDIQAPVTKSPKAVKVGKTARMSLKPLEHRFSARLRAQGGPSKVPKKEIEVISLISGDEENPRDVGTAVRQIAKDTNVDQGDEEEEEDPGWEEEDEDEEEEDPE